MKRTSGVGSAARKGRDWELVRFVGRHGLVAMRHVEVEMGVGRTAAYRRVASCVEAGLLERVELLRSEPGLLIATRDGLRFAGLGLPRAAVSPGTVDHSLRCVTTAQLAGEEFGRDRVLTEREIVFAEMLEGKPVASATVGRHRSHSPRLHRPDVAVLTDEGTIAVEVELTPKAPQRLQGLIRSWRRAIMDGVVTEVRYLCEPGQARRGVERAVREVRAEDVISISEAVPR